MIASVVTRAQAERNVRDSIINISDDKREQYLNQDFDIRKYFNIYITTFALNNFFDCNITKLPTLKVESSMSLNDAQSNPL